MATFIKVSKATMDGIKTAASSMKKTNLLKGLRGWKESLLKRRG